MVTINNNIYRSYRYEVLVSVCVFNNFFLRFMFFLGYLDLKFVLKTIVESHSDQDESTKPSLNSLNG